MAPCHVLRNLMVWTMACSGSSPFLGRDEGVSAKLSEDKEDLGHLGSQKSRAPGDLRSQSGQIYHCRERSKPERSLTWLRSPSSLMTKQLVRVRAMNSLGAPGNPRDQVSFPQVPPLSWQRVG